MLEANLLASKPWQETLDDSGHLLPVHVSLPSALCLIWIYLQRQKSEVFCFSLLWTLLVLFCNGGDGDVECVGQSADGTGGGDGGGSDGAVVVVLIVVMLVMVVMV